MYLVEIKLGDAKIQRFVMNNESLARLIKENPQYEYVKIIQEVKQEQTKARRRKR